MRSEIPSEVSQQPNKIDLIYLGTLIFGSREKRIKYTGIYGDTVVICGVRSGNKDRTVY